MEDPDLQSAIDDFIKALPDWWYNIGLGLTGANFSCAPDKKGRDAWLLVDTQFYHGFHVDMPHLDGWNKPSKAIRHLTRQAVHARTLACREARIDPRR